MKYEKILRRLRQNMFNYSEAKQEKASELISKIKDRLGASRRGEPKCQFYTDYHMGF